MEIKFLYLQGCPHTDAALALLKSVLADLHVADEPLLVEITDESDAVANQFLGSPTILVDGKDVETSRKDDTPLYGCRIYKTLVGNQGIPSREMIVFAILKGHSEPTKGNH